MCGIFFSCSVSRLEDPVGKLRSCLEKRGPDHCQTIGREGRGKATSVPREVTKKPDYFLKFLSTVLSLRGDEVVKQPSIDPNSTSVLCWNGEAWAVDGNAIAGNDTEAVFDLLLQATNQEGGGHKVSTETFPGEIVTDRVVKVFSRIAGPYAFVYYDGRNAQIFYGRDALGRRSLLTNKCRTGSLAISSICDPENAHEWEEVDADGVYMLDLLTEGEIFQRSAERRAYDEKYDLPVPEKSMTDDCSVLLSKASLVSSHQSSPIVMALTDFRYPDSHHSIKQRRLLNRRAWAYLQRRSGT